MLSGEYEALVSHILNLDSHELFSQLCVVTNLVQLGPRRGVFYANVTIADGVVRILRKWLAQRVDIDDEKAGKDFHRLLSKVDSSKEQRHSPSSQRSMLEHALFGLITIKMLAFELE